MYVVTGITNAGSRELHASDYQSVVPCLVFLAGAMSSLSGSSQNGTCMVIS